MRTDNVIYNADDLEIGIVYSICCALDADVYYRVFYSPEIRHFAGGTTHKVFLLEKDESGPVDLFTFLYDDMKIIISEIELFNWAAISRES